MNDVVPIIVFLERNSVEIKGIATSALWSGARLRIARHKMNSKIQEKAYTYPSP